MAKRIIMDKMRSTFLETINFRLRQNKSVMIFGEYGVGKTTLLSQIDTLKLNKMFIRIESLDAIEKILAHILNESGFNVPSTRNSLSDNLKKIKDELTGVVLLIDEAQELKRSCWPYMKRIMDSSIPIIFAGTKELKSTLLNKHKDILSRVVRLELQQIDRMDIENKHSENADRDAIQYLLGKTESNMRIYFEYFEQCMARAKELKKDKIDMEMIENEVKLMLIGDVGEGRKHEKF